MRINPFRQVDFLYFYSLQAGVVMCSSIGIFLSVTTLTVNLASENPEVDGKILLGHYLLICVYGLFALLGFTLGLMAAYQESRTLALAAALVQSIMFLYWFVFLILSFTNKPEFIRRFCIDNRCPDHLWIQDSRWRVYTNTCDPADLKLPLLSNSKKQMAQIIKGLEIIDGNIILSDKYTENQHINDNSEHKIKKPIITSIINNGSIGHNFTVKTKKITSEVKKSFKKPEHPIILNFHDKRNIKEKLLALKPGKSNVNNFTIRFKNITSEVRKSFKKPIEDPKIVNFHDKTSIKEILLAPDADVGKLEKSIVHNFTIKSKKINFEVKKSFKKPVEDPIIVNYEDDYDTSNEQDLSQYTYIGKSGKLKASEVRKSFKNPVEDPIIVNFQDDYDTPNVQEKLWVPHAGIGKSGLIIASAIFTFLIGFFLIYSVTTLISYRYELAELEELED